MHADPLTDRPVVIQHRDGPHGRPPVPAFPMPQPIFRLERSVRCERLSPRFLPPPATVWMNAVEPSPPLPCVERLSGKGMPTRRILDDAAIRLSDPQHLRG